GSARGGRTTMCAGRWGSTGCRPSTELISTRTTWTAMLIVSAIQGHSRRLPRRPELRGTGELSTAHSLQQPAEPGDRLGEPRRAYRERDSKIPFARRAE